MKKYQPLVLEKLDVRVPAIHVRQLALHRHLPETTAVRPHAHKFAQCLLYLSGQGRQQIKNHSHLVQTGTAVFLPPGVEHAFHREANRRPVCLVIDFDWRGARHKPPRCAPLPLSSLHEARQQLAAIAHLQRRAHLSPPLQMSALILRLLDLLLNGAALMPAHNAHYLSPISRKIESLLGSPDAAGVSLGKLAQLAGYQHDYLNRLLKNHSGLTLGQFRARKLVARAQQLLPQAKSVAEVSGALGFADPNYFSRWFRKQTGMAPNRWRHGRPTNSY